MLEITPIPNNQTQTGVLTEPKPTDRVDELDGVQPVAPVGQEPITNEEMMDALAEEREDRPEDFLSKEEEEGLQQRMEALTEQARLYGHHLSFQLHRESDQMVVQVVNKEGELIRQIPPDEFINMQSRLAEMRGTLIDTFA